MTRGRSQPLGPPLLLVDGKRNTDLHALLGFLQLCSAKWYTFAAGLQQRRLGLSEPANNRTTRPRLRLELV